MSQMQLLSEHCSSNLRTLKAVLSDFSDTDMLVRPCPGANHAVWQLGHLIGSEVGMVASAGASMPALPPGFSDKYTNTTACNDDPAFFHPKAQLLDLLESVRAATAAWILSLTDADLAKPGPERLRSIAPTIGHFILMIFGHLTMHLGQVQVIRRKLGKPVLF
jgi:hypothetical protein